MLGLAALLSGMPPSAQAQGWGFFGGGSPPPFPYGDRPARRMEQPDDRLYRPAPRRRAVVARPRSIQPEPVTVPPNASHFILVLGDSLAQRLANGLDDALTDRPDVAILHDGRDSTGFVRTDFYDWPKAAADLLASADTKVDVAVMMIGTNDRQGLSEGSQSFVPLSDEWTAIYTRRALAFAEAFKKKKIPLIWVGVPITRSDVFAKHMAALNDIYREVASKTGAVYIDTWEAFSDGQGNFSPVGPDVDGQIVRLRSDDGVHFTKAGDRKLANFVETAIRRALAHETDMPAVASHPVPESPNQDKTNLDKTPPKPAPKADIGPVISLTASPVADNGKLVTPSAYRTGAYRNSEHPAFPAASATEDEKVVPRGRADDMSWPKR